MQNFRQLRVWQEGHALALKIYRLTRNFPADERYGVTSQVRRAAVSVVANIVEGSKRKHRAEFSRFINVAEASIAEIECLLMLATDLAFAPKEDCSDAIADAGQVGRQLHHLRQRVDSEVRPQTADR